MKSAALLLAPLVFVSSLLAVAPVALPAPQKSGGKALMDTLAQRSTARAFDARELSDQQLSDLLWAAFGVNRPDGKRTAPSARNVQETDLYVLLQKGAYRYNAQANRLDPVADGDLRPLGAMQAFAKEAPVILILVADLSRASKGGPDQSRLWANLDAGYISQNIYLYCTAFDLVTGARGSIEKDKLAAALKLTDKQEIILAHSVGYPVKH